MQIKNKGNIVKILKLFLYLYGNVNIYHYFLTLIHNFLLDSLDKIRYQQKSIILFYIILILILIYINIKILFHKNIKFYHITI